MFIYYCTTAKIMHCIEIFVSTKVLKCSKKINMVEQISLWKTDSEKGVKILDQSVYFILMPLGKNINPFSLPPAVHIYLPSYSARKDTRSIFEQSTTGLNLEFSFSSISCHTEVRAQSAQWFISNWVENTWSRTFLDDMGNVKQPHIRLE